jgi:hypothetical protein
MANPISNNLRFFIDELILVTKLGNFDLSDKFEELNIFDTILNPCMSGNILITDALNLTSKFNFDGSDLLKISIKKDPNGPITFKKTFKIYEKGKTLPLTTTSEQYTLSFVSEEYYFSKTKKLQKMYIGRTYSDIAQEIIVKDLNVPKKFIIENTLGILNYSGNNKTPFEFLTECATKAISADDQSPTYVFFENKNGFNFVSLSYIAKQNPIARINYAPKNFGTDDEISFYGAMHLEVISQFDVIDNINSGYYGSSGVYVDYLNRRVITKNIGPISNNTKSKQLNKNPEVSPIPEAVNPNLRTWVVYGPTVIATQNNTWVKENNPTATNTLDDVMQYFGSRPAEMRKYTEKRVKLVMPGNFNLICGSVVDLLVTSRAQNISTDSRDDSLSGKYIVLACRHIIKYDRHETILEISTDSNNKELYRPQSQY